MCFTKGVVFLASFASSHLFPGHFQRVGDIPDPGSETTVDSTPPPPAPNPVHASNFYRPWGPALLWLVDFSKIYCHKIEINLAAEFAAPFGKP